MKAKIKTIIQNTHPNATVYTYSSRGDDRHFEAIVISEAFNDLPLIKQHQSVMNALKEEFSEALHALALKTFTPAKWDTKKHEYNLDLLN